VKTQHPDIVRLALAAAALFSAPQAFACSSCGFTLNSDWSSQGYAVGEGVRVDLRYDYLNQTQLRNRRSALDRGSLELPAEDEIQQNTRNQNITVGLDYSPTHDWGFNLQVPYFDRLHTTIAPGDSDISTSHTQSAADIRVTGRYQGFSPDRSSGVQFGLKLPTGSFHNDFTRGPQAGTRLDRGLQPGTGSTDLLLGIYHFGALDESWDYFAQALLQQPLNSREDFKPGTGLNANCGVRYSGNETIASHLQINVRSERRDSGSNADIPNSGATLVYLSPGVTLSLGHSLSAFAFLQLPIYQHVNGLQLEPRYTLSVGLRYAL
jgi:hypothetical protein